ncbi:HAD family hydrolase [Kutzneria sp. CA-103260]|uniref:HAD family hydrolase n=1 Tax=Kutzneria sp. CA-103260 TaxID=2802641 RepID=UPI001BA86E96|nr:HAD family phosphatase [Kutzneria sp. CA-103260]QUQ67494.1 Phosphoglycolate phosphatase [Kutzneria sp. CA-103260]
MTVAVTEASVVIFDVEGVILDTEPTWDKAQEILLSRRGHTYDRSALKHLITGLGDAQAISVIVDHYELDDDPFELAGERHELMKELLSRGVRYIPGAWEFIAAAATSADICAATSMNPHLLGAVLAGSDLQARFPGPMFTTGAGIAAKPAPDLFLHAATELGATPDDCLVIEDSPTGIAAARAAGMRCVALCTTHERHRLRDADLVAERWAEVPRPAGSRRPGARSRTPNGTCQESK